VDFEEIFAANTSPEDRRRRGLYNWLFEKIDAEAGGTADVGFDADIAARNESSDAWGSIVADCPVGRREAKPERDWIDRA